jgi:hypothetical protein
MGQVIQFPAPRRVFKAAIDYVECVVIVPHGDELAAWVMTNECCCPLVRGGRAYVWNAATLVASERGFPVRWASECGQPRARWPSDATFEAADAIDGPTNNPRDDDYSHADWGGAA